MAIKKLIRDTTGTIKQGYQPKADTVTKPELKEGYMPSTKGAKGAGSAGVGKPPKTR